MKMIVLYEKYGNRYIDAGNTKETIAAAAAAIVKERVNNKFYEEDELVKINSSLTNNKALDWLHKCRDREYQNFDIVEPEIL
jgi:hypothetical protein